MTEQEAIKWIKDHHCPDDWALDCEDTRAMRMAIEALEKQTPKKVRWRELPMWGFTKKRPICRVCESDLVRVEFFGDGEKVSYCDCCGQKIVWE